MKRLLYYTDSHYTKNGPRSRKDDYRQSIKSKLYQIDQLSRDHNVDVIISGGDVTHHDTEPYEIFMDLFEYHSNTFRKHIVIAGLTHDFKSDFNTGIHKSTLGALWKTGVVDVKPQTYDFQLEDVKFHSSHQTICPNPYFGHFQLYKDFKTDASVVLISHMHMSFGIQLVNGITFVSPGSISRNSIDSYNWGRIPQVALIEVNGSEFEVNFIPLKVELDVFDEKFLLKNQESSISSRPRTLDQLEGFMGQNEGYSEASSIIQSVGQRYSDEAVEMALKLNSEASQND